MAPKARIVACQVSELQMSVTTQHISRKKNIFHSNLLIQLIEFALSVSLLFL